MFKIPFNTILKSGLFSLACITHFSYADVLEKTEVTDLTNLQNTALNSTLSYDLIESLTTEVGPRLVGTEGDKKSITWAVDKMRALGFDKVWTEEVSGTYWHRGDVEARIVSPYPQKVVAIALGGSIGTGDEGLTGNIAHFETLKDLEAVPDNSLNGKIVFISHKMFRHIDGNGYGPAVGARVSGASVAAKKGASAIIIRSIGTDNNRLAHTGIMRYQEDIDKIPAASISNPDADMLMNQLKRSNDIEFYLKLTSHTDTKVDVKTANVIGEITGSEFPEEIVSIGAHLDSWDIGTGAVDDGIGVGMMMASAHHIAQLPKRPKRTIRVILFAAEEVGLLVAKQYVITNKDIMKQHVIGAEWDFGVGPIYEMRTGVGVNSLTALNEFAQFIKPMGVNISKTNTAKAQSDMSLFTEAGMPSISFAPDGNLYFDYHHSENDTLDKVDAKALKHNTAIYTMFAYFSAQSGVDFTK